MKKIDIFFAIVAAAAVADIVDDFLVEFGLDELYRWLALIILLSLSPFCLWVALQIGKKAFFVYQLAKNLLAGAFVSVIDVKIFQFFILFLPDKSIVSKTASFLLATIVKYVLNKYWAFEKHGKEEMKREMVYFSLITLVGLFIDIGIFSYVTNRITPQFGMNEKLWLELGVIIAAFGAATWNFLGYKLIVFKK